jgi:hypothetical protein
MDAQDLAYVHCLRGPRPTHRMIRCTLQHFQTATCISFKNMCRAVIEQWVSRFHTDPATGAPLQVSQLYPNLIIRDLIQAWMVSNAHKLDPALVQRVTREGTPGSYLNTPVSDHTLAFDRTSSFGLGSENTPSMALDGVSTNAPTSATSASAVAAAGTTAARLQGSSTHSTELVVESHPTNLSTAIHSPSCEHQSKGGRFTIDHAPASHESFSPIASLKQRRHSTALSGHSSATDSLIPATSQQEFSPMGAASFPAGLLLAHPQQHRSAPTIATVVCTQQTRVSKSGFLPTIRPPDSMDTTENGSLSLSAVIPLCCGNSESTSTNSHVQETGCYRDCVHSFHENSTEGSVAVAEDVLCQQRLQPVRLLSRSRDRPSQSSSGAIAADSNNLGGQTPDVVSPGYQVPRSWDSDELLRTAAGGVVKKASMHASHGDGSQLAADSSHGNVTSDTDSRAAQDELDRLIA